MTIFRSNKPNKPDVRSQFPRNCEYHLNYGNPENFSRFHTENLKNNFQNFLQKKLMEMIKNEYSCGSEIILAKSIFVNAANCEYIFALSSANISYILREVGRLSPVFLCNLLCV